VEGIVIPEIPVMTFGDKPAVRAVGTPHSRASLDSFLGWLERSGRLSDDDKASVRRAAQKMRNASDDEISDFIAQMQNHLMGGPPTETEETVSRVPPAEDVEQYAKPVAGGPSGPVYDPFGPNRYANRNRSGERNVEPMFSRTSSGAAGLGPAYMDRPRELVERFDARVTSEPLYDRTTLPSSQTRPPYGAAPPGEGLPYAGDEITGLQRQQYARAAESKRREALNREAAASSSPGPEVPDDVRKMADMARSMARASDSGYWNAEQLAEADRRQYQSQTARRQVKYSEPTPLETSIPGDVRRAGEAARMAAVNAGRAKAPAKVQRFGGRSYTPHTPERRRYEHGHAVCTCDGCRGGGQCCGE
jgi:hypothetical protein